MGINNRAKKLDPYHRFCIDIAVGTNGSNMHRHHVSNAKGTTCFDVAIHNSYLPQLVFI